jgi:hypothetical protein
MVHKFPESNTFICVCNILKNGTLSYNISVQCIQQIYLNYQTLQWHACNIGANFSVSYTQKSLYQFTHTYTTKMMHICNNRNNMCNITKIPKNFRSSLTVAASPCVLPECTSNYAGGALELASYLLRVCGCAYLTWSLCNITTRSQLTSYLKNKLVKRELAKERERESAR